MKIFKSLAIILAFLAAGEAVSFLINGFIPGSVVGMLLLFLCLCLKIVKVESIRVVADFLTDNMSIFFIPAFVGIMEQWGLIKLHFWGWIAVLVITTLIVMAVSGLSAGMMIHLKKGGRK